MIGGGGLAQAASVGAADPPDSLLGHVRAFLAAQAPEQGTCTATCAPEPPGELVTFADATGQRYRPLLISHRAGDRLGITGVAVVELEPDAHFVHPGMVAAQLSRCVLEAGDAEAILIEP